MAEQLKVSRSCLREALKALEVLGFVESRHGEGSYISYDIGNSIFKSLSIAFSLGGGKVNDVLELRYALEIQSVRILAERGTDEEIQELEDIVDKMSQDLCESEKSKLDNEFHTTLIKNTNNILFETIADSVSGLLEIFIKRIREIYVKSDETMKVYYFVDQHRNIVNAIKERNPEKAMKVLSDHLYLTEEDLKDLNSNSL